MGRNVMMARARAGVEIEEDRSKASGKDPAGRHLSGVGWQGYQGAIWRSGLGLSGNAINSFVKFAIGTYKAYEATDASIVEINVGGDQARAT